MVAMRKTGEPLVLSLDGSTSSEQYSAWAKRQFEKIGVQLELRLTDYARFKERVRQAGHQLYTWGWVADYPDPENFLFLFESSQGAVKCECDGANTSNYDREEYDQLFETMKSLDNGPERAQVVRQMVDMLWKDQPWIWHYHDTSYYLSHDWVRNTKRHGISLATLKFIGIDPEKRAQFRQSWNQPKLWPLFWLVILLSLVVFGVVRSLNKRKKSQLKI